MSDSDIPSPWLFRSWIGALLVLVILLSVLGTVTDVFGIFVHRKAVEQSLQYSVTNTDEFYANLASVKKIDAQIAGLPADDPQVPALRSQREFLVGECRRAVAKIPANSRTADMFPYTGGSL